MKDDYETFFNKALKFLSYRPRSVYEVKNYLIKKNISSETLEKVLKRLSELNFINDEDFAKWWIEKTKRIKGRELLRLELGSKGISKEIIDNLISKERSREDDLFLAEKIALKKLEKLGDLPPLEIKKKLYRFLFQKGFSAEIASKTVDKILKKGYNRKA